jgi:hypothetical protein
MQMLWEMAASHGAGKQCVFDGTPMRPWVGKTFSIIQDREKLLTNVLTGPL